MFQETFNPYRPSVIAWPALAPDELRRLHVAADLGHRRADGGQARGSASPPTPIRSTDSGLRSTIMLNAWEESRHKEVLSHLVRAYGIELAS